MQERGLPVRTGIGLIGEGAGAWLTCEDRDWTDR